jgi:hypothetical protein
MQPASSQDRPVPGEPASPAVIENIEAAWKMILPIQSKAAAVEPLMPQTPKVGAAAYESSPRPKPKSEAAWAKIGDAARAKLAAIREKRKAEAALEPAAAVASEPDAALETAAAVEPAGVKPCICGNILAPEASFCRAGSPGNSRFQM